MKPLTSTEWPNATCVMQAEIDRVLEVLLALGFRPAFFDYATCTLHASRHADGQPANIHTLDGLPDEVVVIRSCDGVIAVKASLMAGFERNGYFFTRAAACRAAREWGL